MNDLEVMIAVIVVGFILLMIGYARRNRDSGIYTIALGILIMFGTIGYKLYIEFGI
ncbi:hypothetical protein [Stutzerimonas nosocomialis]|uniref:hypothetical protein n=1 Tax=Stutzerimonas nosocomialis TaxID=1056496 RepID=UPI00157648BA|nr:hypothetical protein [Stutzerimonas nosocomialis]